jgi:flagellar protein FlbD
VIILTRLGNGLPIAVNPDLIERAEHTPDTVVTLTDGHKLVVEEPLEVVVEMIRTWRASVAAEAISLAEMSSQQAPHTSALAADRRARQLAEQIDQAANADAASHGSPLGRVLRLPHREA